MTADTALIQLLCLFIFYHCELASAASVAAMPEPMRRELRDLGLL
jgi:hypothetical protein